MKKSGAFSSILLSFIFSGLFFINAASQSPKDVEKWFDNLSHSKPQEKITKLHFYFHDLNGGKKVTSAQVAQANMTGSSPTYFGSLITADDPLTLGPEFVSKQVGYARGFCGASSMEEVAVVMAMTFVFTDPAHNGSSISVLGHNPESHTYREVPVVGGSGLFRMARGTATLQTYYYNPSAGNATIEVDTSFSITEVMFCIF